MSMVVFRTEYFDILQDVNAALLMSQIHYWYMPDEKGQSKLRVYKHGKWLLAKSHKDWYEETRLTRRQVDRALAVLADNGLISILVLRWNGHPTRHIVCDVLSGTPMGQRKHLDLAAAFAHCTPGGTPSHPQVQTGAPGSALITESTAETTAETTTLAGLAGEDAAEDVQPETAEKDSVIMNAADVLKAFKEKKTMPTGTNVTALSMLWKKLASADGQWIKNLTGKEVGQLKIVLNALGDRARPTLEWTLGNWQKFAFAVQTNKGVQPAMVPNIGFFAAHFEVAVQLIAQPAVTIVPQKSHVEVVKLVAIPQNAETDLAGEQDVQETLEALKALQGK